VLEQLIVPMAGTQFLEQPTETHRISQFLHDPRHCV
jgi:hypothetical protein